MGKRIQKTNDHRRIVVAQEAARLIAEHGLSDFRSAKEKAAHRLHMTQKGVMPSNAEIEQALAERQRIFENSTLEQRLLHMRTTARTIMGWLRAFAPRLTGPVLSGHATAHSCIDLHLFSDTPELVGITLDEYGIRYRMATRQHRITQKYRDRFPDYRFSVDDNEVATTVFPERQRKHPPLSPINNKPMARARLRDVETLLRSAPVPGSS